MNLLVHTKWFVTAMCSANCWSNSVIFLIHPATIWYGEPLLIVWLESLCTVAVNHCTWLYRSSNFAEWPLCVWICLGFSLVAENLCTWTQAKLILFIYCFPCTNHIMPKVRRRPRPRRNHSRMVKYLTEKCFICLDSPSKHPSKPLLCCSQYIHEDCLLGCLRCANQAVGETCPHCRCPIQPYHISSPNIPLGPNPFCFEWVC